MAARTPGLNSTICHSGPGAHPLGALEIKTRTFASPRQHFLGIGAFALPVHSIIWPKLPIIFYVHSDVYMFLIYNRIIINCRK